MEKEIKNKVKKRKRTYLSTRLEAVKAYREGEAASKIAERIGVSEAAVYLWINKYKSKSKRFFDTFLNSNNNDKLTTRTVDTPAPAVEENYHSLAEDFGLLQFDNNKTDNADNTELNFCPHCGTDIKAVRIALETCKSIKQHA